MTQNSRRQEAYLRRLVVMVKEPQAGRVKTRLARSLGAVAAVSFYRHATAAILSRAVAPGCWRTILAVAPDTAARSRAWSHRIERRAQGRGDLGQRMQRLMDRLPPGPVVIIGSDSPDLRREHIRAAFRALGRHDAVLGPAPDGGYWLIGLKRLPRVLRPFKHVRWSTEHAAADTLFNLRSLRVARLCELPDIDQARDLALTRGRFGRRVVGALSRGRENSG